MTEILTVTPPPDQLWWIIWFGLAFALAGILITILIQGDDGGGFLAAGILMGAMWAGIWFMGMSFSNDDNWDQKKVEALEDLGYSNVSVGHDEFEATKNNQYVKGILYPQESDPNSFQVVLIPPGTDR